MASDRPSSSIIFSSRSDEDFRKRLGDQFVALQSLLRQAEGLSHQIAYTQSKIAFGGESVAEGTEQVLQERDIDSNELVRRHNLFHGTEEENVLASEVNTAPTTAAAEVIGPASVVESSEGREVIWAH